jgi:hypothetical protein
MYNATGSLVRLDQFVSSTLNTYALAYCSAGFVVVISKVGELAPGFNPTSVSYKAGCRQSNPRMASISKIGKGDFLPIFIPDCLIYIVYIP